MDNLSDDARCGLQRSVEAHVTATSDPSFFGEIEQITRIEAGRVQEVVTTLRRRERFKGAKKT